MSDQGDLPEGTVPFIIGWITLESWYQMSDTMRRYACNAIMEPFMKSAPVEILALTIVHGGWVTDKKQFRRLAVGIMPKPNNKENDNGKQRDGSDRNTHERRSSLDHG